MTCPTGTSSPSAAVTLASTPSAGASSSTVALSVSTSTTGSPFFTCSPSTLSHCTILPVSCAIPNTGKITSVAMLTLLPLLTLALGHYVRVLHLSRLAVGCHLPGCSDGTGFHVW